MHQFRSLPYAKGSHVYLVVIEIWTNQIVNVPVRILILIWGLIVCEHEHLTEIEIWKYQIVTITKSPTCELIQYESLPKQRYVQIK